MLPFVPAAFRSENRVDLTALPRSTRSKALISLMSSTLLLMLLACGGTGGSNSGSTGGNNNSGNGEPPPPAAVQPARFLYVYVSGGFSKNGPIPPGITGFTINGSTGALTALPASPFAVPFPQNQPMATYLAATPDGKFLYVNGDSEIVEYAIGADGALTDTAEFPEPASRTTELMRITPSGKFLYRFRDVLDTPGFQVSALQISPSGALVPVTQPAQSFSGTALEDAGITPSGAFLYAVVQNFLSPCPAAGCEKFEVVAFAIDQNTGALTPVSGSPFAATDLFPNKECDCPDFQRMGMAIDGQGRFMYLPNTVTNNSIAGFAIDGTTGALTSLPGSPFASGSGYAGAVDPAGKFLFTTTSVIFASHIGTAGALSTLPGSPFAGATVSLQDVFANELQVDPSGRFLYVENRGSGAGSIGVFNIAADGTLKEVPGSPFQTPEMLGDGPVQFTVVP